MAEETENPRKVPRKMEFEAYISQANLITLRKEMHDDNDQIVCMTPEEAALAIKWLKELIAEHKQMAIDESL